MTTASACSPCPPADLDGSEASLPISVQIARFLTGETNGEEPLKLLYGDVTDEPVPERFRALVRNYCGPRIVVG